jgi:BMFP domain-containing protein YqiC
MINREAIDKLAQEIGDFFSKDALQHDIQGKLRALLLARLSKMDLVTREDFDAQAAILQRTRTKLDQLENQLAELSRQLEPPGK